MLRVSSIEGQSSYSAQCHEDQVAPGPAKQRLYRSKSKRGVTSRPSSIGLWCRGSLLKVIGHVVKLVDWLLNRYWQ